MSVAERFTGANIVDAGRLSPYWGEHVARYRFALDRIEGKAVLDIACGTGYGIGVMQHAARTVVGVDVDLEAAKSARAECAANSVILLGDGLSLPFEPESFDVITSFETIEHLNDRGTFLSELSRVLRPAGVLILSTPNANYTLPQNGKPSNPFHIFEYTPDELRREIEPWFDVREHLGQTLDIGSSIPPFLDAQQRLPTDIGTQARLFGWKVMNKLPLAVRESLSEKLWNRPFFPTEHDYLFSSDKLHGAPVQVAVCLKK